MSSGQDVSDGLGNRLSGCQAVRLCLAVRMSGRQVVRMSGGLEVRILTVRILTPDSQILLTVRILTPYCEDPDSWLSGCQDVWRSEYLAETPIADTGRNNTTKSYDETTIVGIIAFHCMIS